MGRQGNIAMFTACVLILVIASTFPLNYVRKHVQDCSVTHKKMAAKQCLRDSVISSDATDTVSLPASAPDHLQKIPVQKVNFLDSAANPVSTSTESPPLRC